MISSPLARRGSRFATAGIQRVEHGHCRWAYFEYFEHCVYFDIVLQCFYPKVAREITS